MKIIFREHELSFSEFKKLYNVLDPCDERLIELVYDKLYDRIGVASRNKIIILRRIKGDVFEIENVIDVNSDTPPCVVEDDLEDILARALFATLYKSCPSERYYNVWRDETPSHFDVKDLNIDVAVNFTGVTTDGRIVKVYMNCKYAKEIGRETESAAMLCMEDVEDAICNNIIVEIDGKQVDTPPFVEIEYQNVYNCD